MRWLLLLLLFSLPGCSFLQVGGSTNTNKSQSIPLKPVHQQPEMKINKQQAVDVIVQLGYEADQVGIGANTTQSNTLLDMALVLQIVEGVPVEKIPWEDSAKVAQLVTDIKKMEGDYRTKVMEWEELLTELATSQDKVVELHKRNSWLQTVIGWLIMGAIILALLCVLFPTVGIPLVFKIIGRTKKMAEQTMKSAVEATEHQFGQVVNAIEETKEKMKEQAPELYDEFKTNLKKNTDESTREVINRLKVKLKK